MDMVRVLIENGCRPAILNIYFTRAIDVCADGFHLAATVAAGCVEGEKAYLPFQAMVQYCAAMDFGKLCKRFL